MEFKTTNDIKKYIALFLNEKGGELSKEEIYKKFGLLFPDQENISIIKFETPNMLYSMHLVINLKNNSYFFRLVNNKTMYSIIFDENIYVNASGLGNVIFEMLQDPDKIMINEKKMLLETGMIIDDNSNVKFFMEDEETLFMVDNFITMVNESLIKEESTNKGTAQIVH